MTELTSLTISDALELMRAGDISARELTEAHLQRIEALDPALGAYLTVTDDLARQQAAAADAARAAGDERPLLGIPIALKDVLSTRGIETTLGSNEVQLATGDIRFGLNDFAVGHPSCLN